MGDILEADETLKVGWRFLRRVIQTRNDPFCEAVRMFLRMARLFYVPLGDSGNPYGVGIAEAASLHIEESISSFVLPFPIVGVVMGEDVIFIERDSTPCVAMGLLGSYRVLYVFFSHANNSVAATCVWATMDLIRGKSAATPVTTHLHSETTVGINSTRGFLNADAMELLSPNCNDLFTDSAVRMCTLAMQALACIQSPDRFILEVAPPTPAKRTRGKVHRVPTLGEKYAYVSLHPREIRRVVGLPEPEAGANPKRRSHERRAHTRLLTSTRYTWKRGQRITVKASWVGPASGVTDNGRPYRVRLDIQSPLRPESP